RARVERRVFLNTEVVADDIERDVGHVADGRDVAGAVPCGLDAELFGEDGDFAGGREASRLRDVAADVIDEAFGDKRGPFVGAVEELAHGDGSGALLTDLAEVRDVFGGERVFHEEEVVLLEVFGEADGFVGGDALVDVMQEADFLAELFACGVEHFQNAADVGERFEDGAGVEALDARDGAGSTAGIALIAGDADLHADVAKALADVAFGAIDDLLDFLTVGVAVDVGRFTAFTADEVVDGHVGHAAFDIPEGLVDAADGVVEDGAVFPVRAVVAGLPDVFDLVDGVVGEEGLEVAFDSGLNEVGALGEGGAAVAVEAVLIGGDLDYVEADALGGGFDDGDVFDFGAWESADGFGDGLLGLVFAGGEEGGEGGGGKGFEEIAAVHGCGRGSFQIDSIMRQRGLQALCI